MFIPELKVQWEAIHASAEQAAQKADKSAMLASNFAKQTKLRADQATKAAESARQLARMAGNVADNLRRTHDELESHRRFVATAREMCRSYGNTFAAGVTCSPPVVKKVRKGLCLATWCSLLN